MGKLTLEKQDGTKTAGSWLGTIKDERGRVVEQVWRGTSKELDEWFADRQTAHALKESGAEALADAFETQTAPVSEPAKADPAPGDSLEEAREEVTKSETEIKPQRRRR